MDCALQQSARFKSADCLPRVARINATFSAKLGHGHEQKPPRAGTVGKRNQRQALACGDALD
jgi:hypothetical protein